MQWNKQPRSRPDPCQLPTALAVCFSSLAAIKDAQRKAQEKMQSEMARITQELGLPADMKLPF